MSDHRTPIKQSARLSSFFLFVIIGLVTALVAFSPQILNFVNKAQKQVEGVRTSSSSQVTASKTITIKNLFNQKCTLIQNNLPAIEFSQFETTSVWYSRTNQCLDNTFEKVRVVTGLVSDKYATQTLQLARVPATLLVYPEGNQNTNIDLDRYQNIFTEGLYPQQLVFDPLTTFTQFQTRSSVFYLTDTCIDKSSITCAVWVLSRSSGTYEKLYTLPQLNGLVRFAKKQPDEKLLQLVAEKESTIVLYTIDLEINRSVLINNFKKDDPLTLDL